MQRWILDEATAEYYRIATWSFLGLAALYAVTMRIVLAWGLPLWLDESWTAVLSSAPTLASFVRQMWLDSNAPFYYFLIWLWPFESSFGLKVPSLIFMVLSAIVAVLVAPLAPRRRVFWATLLLLWPPAMSLFLDARYYGLLLLLSTGQTIAFVKLLDAPMLKTAAIWTTISTLSVLTHYYAAVPALVQGLFYIFRCKQSAIRTWPAAIITAPAFAWFMFHWPRLKLYGQEGISWYPRLTWSEAAQLLVWPLGGGVLALGVALLAFALRDQRAPTRSAIALGVTSIISTVILLIAGISLPVFTQRYLIPLAPPILYAVAAVARPSAFLPIAALMFVQFAGFRASAEQLDKRSNFGLEKSVRMIPSGATVTWMIDYEGSHIHDRAQMQTMLMDAFARNGTKAIARWGTDFENGNALLAIYQQGRRPTVLLPNWPCRRLSGWGRITLVCVRNGQFSGTRNSKESL